MRGSTSPGAAPRDSDAALAAAAPPLIPAAPRATMLPVARREATRPMPSNPDLLSAAKAFQQGDRAGFDALYQGLWPAVRARALRMGVSAEEADDLAQKVLVRVYLYAPRAEFATAAQLWAWAYRIATREVYKHWGRRRPGLIDEEAVGALTLQLGPAEPDPADQAQKDEALRDVGRCVGLLEEAAKLYLLGPLAGGLTFRQAAAVHGMSLGQFKHRYEKALAAVRDCLRRKGHEVAD
jgi:RNA polymerase sigma factor (sigma-70 family)